MCSATRHEGFGPKADITRSIASPEGMQHFAWFTEESIIQLHGMGPQDITYVNPADDPRKSN